MSEHTCITAGMPDGCKACAERAALMQRIVPDATPWCFSIERLVKLLLFADVDALPAWRKQAEIIVGHLPPFADKNTQPKCVVRFGDLFLRHSVGPRQRYFWDTYGDDFLYPELALLALYNAESPMIGGKAWTVY